LESPTTQSNTAIVLEWARSLTPHGVDNPSTPQVEFVCVTPQTLNLIRLSLVAETNGLIAASREEWVQDVILVGGMIRWYQLAPNVEAAYDILEFST
jgi:hypothetical protein